jgi:hypothetical protein
LPGAEAVPINGLLDLGLLSVRPRSHRRNRFPRRCRRDSPCSDRRRVKWKPLSSRDIQPQKGVAAREAHTVTNAIAVSLSKGHRTLFLCLLLGIFLFALRPLDLEAQALPAPTSLNPNENKTLTSINWDGLDADSAQQSSQPKRRLFHRNPRRLPVLRQAARRVNHSYLQKPKGSPTTIRKKVLAALLFLLLFQL